MDVLYDAGPLLHLLLAQASLSSQTTHCITTSHQDLQLSQRKDGCVHLAGKLTLVFATLQGKVCRRAAGVGVGVHAGQSQSIIVRCRPAAEVLASEVRRPGCANAGIRASRV